MSPEYPTVDPLGAASEPLRHPSESGQTQKPDKLKPKRATPAAIDHVFARLMVLALILAAVEFWLQRHLAYPWLEKFSEAPLITVLLPFLAAFVDRIGGKRNAEGLQRFWRRLSVVLLRTPVLAFFAVAVLMSGSMISSVTILAESDLLPVRATVKREAAPARDGPGVTDETEVLDKDNKSVRFLRRTNPFGRTFVARVEGYRPYSFSLYPWVGQVVRLRDLTLAPSIFVRVPLGHHATLSTGRLSLSDVATTKILGEVYTSGFKGSVIFGRKLPLPREWFSQWEHDLRAENAQGQSYSRSFVVWRQPLVTNLPIDLRPGQKVSADYFSTRDATKPSASEEIEVTAESLQDVLLTPQPSEP